MDVRMPDGTIVRGVPEGTSKDEILARYEAKKSGPGFGRQLGLTARHAIEGAAAIPAMAANAVAGAANMGLDAVGSDYRFPDQAQNLSGLLNKAGLPQPETATERVVGDASRALAGGGGVAGVGRSMAGAADDVAAGVGRALSERMGTQAASEIAAGGASGAAREGGAPVWLQNALGVTAGMGAPLAGPVTRGAANLITSARDVFTQPGRERIAGDILLSQADDATRAMDNLGNPGPSVTQQGTGPVSLDSGLLAFHRMAQNTDPSGSFAAAASRANSKRQRILDALAPDDVPTLKAERDAVTGPMRESALEASDGKVVDVDSIRTRIDEIAAAPEGKRRTVQSALQAVRNDLEGVADARTLYEVRKDINLAMEGKLKNPDRSDMQHAKSQLWHIKKEIDARIEDVAPGFRDYLDQYAEMSRHIDNTERVQAIKNNAVVATPSVSGGQVDDVLSQAKFRRMVRKERAEGALPEEMLTVLESIADDLDMAVTPNAFKPSGSDTVQNSSVAHIVGSALGGSGGDNAVLHALTRPLQWLAKYPDEQVQAILVDAMLDPTMAKQLMQGASDRSVNRFSHDLQSRMWAAGLGTAAGQASHSPKQQP